MLAALGNVVPSHLLDKGLAAGLLGVDQPPVDVTRVAGWRELSQESARTRPQSPFRIVNDH